MNEKTRFLWLGAGILLGIAGAWLVLGQLKPAEASSPTTSNSVPVLAGKQWQTATLARLGDDRHEDYVLSTGAVSVGLAGPDLDGVWLLDYRAGKLLGTAVNRLTGKISGWAEVDLVSEFGIPPRQNVHFLMTTGMVARGQAALYVAETTTGKFGVYTMTVAEGPRQGILIKRHDMVLFRAPKPG